MGKIVIDDFLGGLAPSSYVGGLNQGDPGSLSSPRTYGFDVNYPDSIGVLRRGFQQDTITNASLMGAATLARHTIIGQSPHLYILGNHDYFGNRLYDLDITTNTLVSSSLFPRTVPGLASYGLGLELFGNYLWYVSGRYLGRYDLSATFNDSFNVSLSTAAYGGSHIQHPTAQGNGKLYIGNVDTDGNAILTTVDSSDVVNFTALDLTKTRQFIRALEFSGDTLYIGMSADKGNALGTPNAESSVLIWDTVSASYQRKVRFPNGEITNIQSGADGIYVFGRTGVYVMSGDSFIPITSKSNGGPGVDGADINADGVLFWKTGQGIMSYGSSDPALQKVVNMPFFTMGAANAFIKWTSRLSLYVGGFSDRPYIRRFTSSATGGWTSVAQWATPFFQFSKRCRCTGITVYTLPLPTGCEFAALWAKDDGSSPETIAAFNTAGATKHQFSPDGLVDYSWQIRLYHGTGDTPQIRRVEIDYEEEDE